VQGHHATQQSNTEILHRMAPQLFSGRHQGSGIVQNGGGGVSTNHFQLLGGKRNTGGVWAAAPPAARRTVRVELHCYIRTNRIECMVLREWVGMGGGGARGPSAWRAPRSRLPAPQTFWLEEQGTGQTRERRVVWHHKGWRRGQKKTCA